MSRRQIASRKCFFPGNRCAGFTLVEILVTLAIVGLIMSFTTTQFRSLYDRRALEGLQRTIISEIQTTQLTSRLRGVESIIDATSLADLAKAKRLSMSDGGVLADGTAPTFTYNVVRVIKVGSDGSCSDGTIMLSSKSLTYELKTTAPFCKIEWIKQFQ